MRFELALRASGLAVNPANLIDFCHSLEHIDVTDRRDFHAAGRVTLVHRQEDLERFDEAFRRFWEATDKPAEPPDFQQDDAGDEGESDSSEPGQIDADKSLELAEERQEVGSDAYSGQEILMQKDLAALTDTELLQARRMLASLIVVLASERGRRHAPNERGNRLDFGRMLRRHSLHSPECVRLLFKREKIRKPRLTLLCDISGSMESYSRFLIEFIFALRRTLPKVEVGVFATRMSMITRLLEDRNLDHALSQVTRAVRDWGGGTDIGGCLGEFNDLYAEKVVRAKTVVVILSDGWDCGDPEQLRLALERLRRRTHRLLWLNPLLGGEGYQPLCTGIRTALHYVDEMLPAHNLESLVSVARILRKVWH